MRSCSNIAIFCRFSSLSGSPLKSRPPCSPLADALSLLQRPARPSQRQTGGRNHQPAARVHARPRRSRASERGRAGACQRAARRGARAPVRGVRRDFVPRLRGGATSGCKRGTRAGSANPRRRQRRRPTDDCAQGQGARVPRRDPCRHRSKAPSRSIASRFTDPSEGLCALKIGGWSPVDLTNHEAEELRTRGGGRRPDRVCRGDARARPSRDPGGWG